jgi:hypothetical protein
MLFTYEETPPGPYGFDQCHLMWRRADHTN